MISIVFIVASCSTEYIGPKYYILAQYTQYCICVCPYIMFLM